MDWLTLEKGKIQRGMLTQPYTSMNSEYNYIPEKGFMFIDPDGSAIMIDMEKQIFLIVLSNSGIRNPENKSFIEVVNNLIDIIKTDIY